MRIAVVGVGVAGAYLMNRIPPEHHVEAFEAKTEKNWWTVCAWGTSEPFIADLVKQAGFNFEDYVLHRGKKMVVDLGDEQIEIPLRGLVTYDKHMLTHDMLEGKEVHWGQQVKQVNGNFSGFDMVVDATGLQRSLLPKIKEDLVIPSLEYQVKSKEIPYDDFVIKPYPGLCVTSDTMVMANPGAKTIEEVKVGERVLTKAGWKEVEQVYSREYTGDLVEITPFLCSFPVGLTPDHLVWVLDRKWGKIGWKPAKEIRECHSKSVGDYVAMPIPNHEPVDRIRMSDYVDGMVENGKIRSKGRNQFGSVFAYRQAFTDEIEITEEFGEFVGYYISEGNAFHDGIILTNYDRQVYGRMKALGERLFGIEGKNYYPNQVQFNSTLLKRMFISLFGEGAHFKRIPLIALGFPRQVRMAMIRGLFIGDGGKESRGGLEYLSYATTSKTLAIGLWQLLLSVGVVGSIGYTKSNNSYRVRIYGSQLERLGNIFGKLALSKASKPPRKYMIREDMLYFAVRKVRRKKVKGLRVHDLRTNGNYATSFLVHNSGYWWYFPLGDGTGHVGAGDLKGRYRYELDEFVKKYHCEVIRKIGRPVRVTPPKFCEPFFDGKVVGVGECFPPFAEIVTYKGLKKISEINVGDQVLTHRGTFKRVSRRFERPFEGNLVAIRTALSPYEELLTPEHPVLGMRERRKRGKTIAFMPASECEVGTLLAVPNPSTWWSPTNPMVLAGDYRYPTKEEMRLSGYFLAEGSTTFPSANSRAYALEFSFGSNESEYVEDVRSLLTNSWGEPYVYETDNLTKVILKRKAPAVWFSTKFGRYSHTKRMPYTFSKFDYEHSTELLKGMVRGDGTWDSRRVRYATVSSELAWQTRWMFNKFGMVAAINARQNNGFGSKSGPSRTIYELTWAGQTSERLRESLGVGPRHRGDRSWSRALHTHEYTFYPVTSFRTVPYAGMVYNLEVEDNNTFVTKSFAVHNCIGTVYPMLGEGIIPSMQCVNLFVDHLGDREGYRRAVLEHFAIYAKVYKFIKAKVEDRFSLLTMWPTLLSIFWYMHGNTRRYGLETRMSDFYKIVTRL